MPIRHLSLAIASLLAVPLAHAQDATATDLDNVVVTATRTPVSADEALAAVEVITREDIERTQPASLPDLLRGRAGISLSNQGGAGKLTTMFLRGSESDHVLVLVDGVRVGSATSGLVAFQDLPVELIERIEIIRGPRSSLYGADAIGGVVQIFTRRASREGTQLRAHAGAGSHGFREGGAGVSGGGERAWFGVDAGYERTDGINACRGIGFPVFAGCFDDEPDRDGYRNRSLSMRAGASAGAWRIEANALRAEGENEYDGSFVNYSETVQQVLGAKLVWEPGGRVRVQLSGGRNDDASENYNDGLDQGDFDTARITTTLQGDFALADGHLLTAGLDWLRDEITSTTPYVVRDRDNHAAFAQYQGRFGSQSLLASLRRDDNEQFGGATTGNVAWGIEWTGGWRASVGYGTAFKAPTFNELYFPFFGNPDLDPERSRTIEAGIAWRGTNAGLRVDAFETRVRDLIAFDAAIFLPDNIERARMRGVELGGDAAWGAWTLQGSLSVLDTENRSDGMNGGNDLARRAHRSARVELDRRFGRFRAGVTGIAEGARYDDVANTRRLGGYATFDLRAEYALDDAWTLQARVANVFDRTYETAAYYNQPGREWFVTVRYSPSK